MSLLIADRLHSATKLLLPSAVLLAFIGPVITGLVSVRRVRAQSPAASFEKPSGPKFEVASVKLAPSRQAASSAGLPPHIGIKIDAARVDIGYWSIRQLVMRAYGLEGYQLSGPDWMDSLRFDVIAKFPEGATQRQLPQMLQWLLVDRFGLVAHRETRDLPALALVLGKGGPKMKPAAPDAGEPPDAASKNERAPDRIDKVGRILDGLMGAGPNGPFGAQSIAATGGGGLHIEVAKMPMDALAMVLVSYLRTPVIDMTGLQGKYQVTLDFSLANAAGSAPGGDATGVASEPSGPSLYSAVQRLGLRLERLKAPIPLLVVDHVERTPKGN